MLRVKLAQLAKKPTQDMDAKQSPYASLIRNREKSGSGRFIGKRHQRSFSEGARWANCSTVAARLLLGSIPCGNVIEDTGEFSILIYPNNVQTKRVRVLLFQ